MAVFAVLIYLLVSALDRPIPIQATLSVLHPTELTDSIAVKGTVESESKKNVYTSLAYPVQEIDVQTGDHVDTGQVMCVLDTADLELSIQQLEAQLNASQKTSENVYENNLRIYNQADADMSSGSNPQVVAAQNAVNAARISQQEAQRVYDETKSNFDNDTDPTVVAAESALASTKLDLDAKEKTYSNNQILHDNGVISQSDFNQSADLYTDAQNKYDAAQKSLDNAKTALSQALDQAKNTLDAAKANFKAASDSYAAAAETANQQLDAYKSSLDSSQIALNQDAALINIQKLQKQLADSTIKAPMSGTVTAVYAEEGSVSAGLLFVIEDTDHLQITSTVREYDYPNVKVGMDVIIQSDSTGDNEYKGVVSRIDPAAVKNALGDTSSTGNVEFGITVTIASAETPLRIGMNTNLSLVVEKKSDIFAVRYDAVIMNDQGQNVLFAAQNAAGYISIRQVPVTVGISNDLYLEVSGDGIKDGLQVVNDASVVADALKKSNKTFDEAGQLKFSLT